MIWKYPIETWRIPGTVRLSLPKGANILCAQSQHEHLAIWALVDTGQVREERVLAVYETGKQLPADPGIYIGTVQFDNGAYVVHVFEATS